MRTCRQHCTCGPNAADPGHCHCELWLRLTMPNAAECLQNPVPCWAARWLAENALLTMKLVRQLTAYADAVCVSAVRTDPFANMCRWQAAEYMPKCFDGLPAKAPPPAPFFQPQMGR